MLKMPKTIIEQELEKHFERVRIFAKQVYDNAGDIENMDEHDNETIVEFERNSLDSAIQKALKEFHRQVESKIKEVKNYDDEAYNYNAGLMKAQTIVEKCFGEIKDAKNK